MTTPLNNKKGTTLVELMVCLVLLALFGTAAVTLVKPCAEAYIEVQQLTRAQNLADALTETIRGELADADGTISIVNAATESDADSANNIFIEDARLTEGTALRFTVESSYTEILDAGYVPKLTATTLNADNTERKKSTRPTLIQQPILTKIIWGLSFRILSSMPADGKRRRKPGRSA